MSIKTNINQEDFNAFGKYVARSVSTSSGSRVLHIFIGLTVGLAIGVSLSVTHLSSDSTTLAKMLCGGLAGAFLTLLVVSVIVRSQMQRMRPAEDGIIIGSHEISLTDEGIRQRSGRHQSDFRWSLVRATSVTDQHIFIMIDRIVGIIVPKRAFSSDAERDQFVSEIQKRSGKIAT